MHKQFPPSLFKDSKYSIDVHGPNGFYRSFSGNQASHHVQIHLEYEKRWGRQTGNVRVHLRNNDDSPLTVSVQDNSYKTGSATKTIGSLHEASVVLRLKESHGWYDFTVKVDGSDTEARFAGRVETGRPSFSDLVMGGVV